MAAFNTVFGADAPSMGRPVTPNQVYAYLTYVDQLVNDLDSAYRRWTSLNPDCSSLEGTPDWWTCQNQGADQRIKAADWNQQIVFTDNTNGWGSNVSPSSTMSQGATISGWDPFLSTWKGFVASNPNDARFQARVIACGALCGPYAAVKRAHEAVIRFSDLAKQSGLAGTPDAGAVPVINEPAVPPAQGPTSPANSTPEAPTPAPTPAPDTGMGAGGVIAIGVGLGAVLLLIAGRKRR